MHAIAVLGTKNSGKTATIEALVRELTRRGYKVATVKHIPKKDFTVDTVGKDTWRFAKAGAKTVLAVSENEIAIIKKGDTSNFTIEQVVQNCGNDASIIILEGFRALVSQDKSIPKIVAVKSENEVVSALESYAPIIAFTGKLPHINFKTEVPYINPFEKPDELADLVEKYLGKK